MRHLMISTIAPIVHPDSIHVYLQSVDTYRIYHGPDELGIVGTVTRAVRPGGSVLGMVYEDPVGQGGHCMEPVTWWGGGRSGSPHTTITVP
jgi:hypothetical protein